MVKHSSHERLSFRRSARTLCRQHGHADARGRPRPPAKNENKTALLSPLGPQDATRPWARRAPLVALYAARTRTRSEGRMCASTRAALLNGSVLGVQRCDIAENAGRIWCSDYLHGVCNVSCILRGKGKHNLLLA